MLLRSLLAASTAAVLFASGALADTGRASPGSVPVSGNAQNAPRPLFDTGAVSTKVDDRCSLPPRSGPCKARFDAYAFDPDEKTCKLFTWGGCGPEPFGTKEDCEKACKSP